MRYEYMKKVKSYLKNLSKKKENVCFICVDYYDNG